MSKRGISLDEKDAIRRETQARRTGRKIEKACGCDKDPYAITSWLAMSTGLKGFKILIKLDGHVVGGGYRTGVRNIPKVSGHTQYTADISQDEIDDG